MGPVPPPKYTSTPSSESTASNSVASSTRPKSHLRPERPAISRTDTDALLSYYYQTGSSTSPSRSPATSPVAEPNSPSAHHPTIRLLSSNSSRSSSRHRQRDSESSEYSAASFEEQERPLAPLRHSPSVLRRSHAPSDKGPDHRRLHVVEMGQIDESATPRLSNKASLRDIGEDIRSRRGMDGGLSLVAPPDVTSSDSCAYPRSPPTAPIISKTISQDKSSVHSRSASEATSSTPTSGKNPREIGIIGMNSTSGTSPVLLTPNTELQPPLFQVPQSRSPSPLVTASQRPSSSERSLSSNRASPAVSSPSPLATPQISSNTSKVATPEIGQEKDIGAPVAPPVIIPLSGDQIPPATAPLSKVSREPSAESSSSMAAQHLPPWVSPPFSPVSTTSSASSFLYYQPGVHATAGPLPPPPRAIFAIDPDAPPPPRPPRMQSPPPPNASLRAAMKQSLLLPASVEKVLATKKSNKSMRSEHDDQQPSNNPAQSLHKRDIAHSEFADSHSSHEHPVGNHIREGAFPPSTIMTNVPTTTETSTSTSTSPPVPEPNVPRSPEIKSRPFDVGNRLSGDSAPSTGLVNPPRSAALHPDSDHGSPPPPVPPAKSSPPRRSRPLSWIGVSPRGSPRASLDSVSSRLSGSSSSSRSSTSEIDHTPPNASLRRITSLRSRSPTPSENDYTLTPSTNAANNLKAAFNLKRFSSLPRTPASILSAASRRSSLSSSSSGGGGGHRRTPSPIYEEEPRQAYEELRVQQPPLEQQERPRPIKPKTKIRTEMPAAMNFSDVLEKKTPGQRAIGYAVKINELWMSDCGLGDWVVSMNERGKNPGRVNKRTTAMPPVPSTTLATAFQHQTRHVSRSSMASEATFPRRPDAYMATDLSVQDGDDFFTSKMPPPPALPYPSLATTPSVARPTPPLSSILSAPASVRLPSTITTKPSMSFFSLGRKNSVSKRERSGTILGNPVSSASIDSSSSIASSRKLLAKSPPAPAPNPRPVQAASTPSVPGGPRAPPTKIRRSQTIMAMAQPMQMTPSTSSQWSDSGHGGYGSGGGGGYRDRDRDTYRLSTIPLRPSVLGPASSSTSTTSSSSSIPKSSSAGAGSPGGATYLRPQDPEFARQVDKLADLLPHAERSVLAGYLRRSGQDILAIGQYLEDEKNGTLRRD